jgi:hypothetical protein
MIYILYIVLYLVGMGITGETIDTDSNIGAGVLKILFWPITWCIGVGVIIGRILKFLK